MEISLEQYNMMAERLTYLEQKLAEMDRPKGEWVFDLTLEPHCSECDYVPDYSPRMDDYFFSDFCPNCGADLRGEGE